MFSILVASFVLACCVTVIVLATVVLRSKTHRQSSLSDEIVLAAEPLRPEWIYGPRQDVPRKYPLLRTRSSKVLG